MRDIAREIKGITGAKLMRHAVNNESHFAFENMNELLLRVRVRWHATPGRQRGHHLIHRLAVCYRPTCDAGTNFNCRIFFLHLHNLMRATWITRSSLLQDWHLALVTRHWQNASHENLYSLNYNSVRDLDRD